MRLRWDDARTWVPEVGLALAVLLLGFVEIDRYAISSDELAWVAVLLGAGAVSLFRHAPGAGLALVWLLGFVHLLLGVPVLGTEVLLGAVFFGAARWGSTTVLTLSGLSIPAALLAGGLLIGARSVAYVLGSGSGGLLSAAAQFGDSYTVSAGAVGLLALAGPWLAGLALRSVARARVSEESEERAQVDAARAQVEASQAQEIARLQEGQARLARDVHDVVGHSLAVILAQAESGQYLPDDPATLKGTLATIATSARESLRDVRQVLSATEAPAPARPGGLEDLVSGVRATGQEVTVDEVGEARPLPPELEVVAFRVVQEMLTNAVKHGRRDRAVRVERHWPQDAFERDLRLEVSNAVAVTHERPLEETQPLSAARTQVLPEAQSEAAGQGLEGMRRRVEAVGGRLDVRRRTGPDGPTFTTTAWLPVRA